MQVKKKILFSMPLILIVYFSINAAFASQPLEKYSITPVTTSNYPIKMMLDEKSLLLAKGQYYVPPKKQPSCSSSCGCGK